MQAYLLYFYDGSATDGQYYPPSSILGFEKVGANQLRVYMKGAKDVDAKDTILITIGTAINYKQAAEYILNGVAYQSVHKSNTKIITIVGATAAESLRPDFTACTITYGACCGMSTWTLSDGATTQVIDNGETVTTADSTYVNNVVSATNTLTTSLSAVDGTSDLSTRFLSKDNTWDVITAPKYYAKSTTAFEWNTATSLVFCVPFGGGTDVVTFASNQLTDDNVRDCVIYDPLGKITVNRIFGFIESASSGGSLGIAEGTFNIGSSYTGTQTFSMGSALATVSQASANTWYPFAITSGFASAAPGLMRALQFTDRAASTRIYKGQITVEYLIGE